MALIISAGGVGATPTPFTTVSDGTQIICNGNVRGAKVNITVNADAAGAVVVHTFDKPGVIFLDTKIGTVVSAAVLDDVATALVPSAINVSAL